MILYNLIPEPIRPLLDWTAFTVALGTFLEMVPHLSGVVGLLWLCIRVWETDTVKGLRKRYGRKRKL